MKTNAFEKLLAKNEDVEDRIEILDVETKTSNSKNYVVGYNADGTSRFVFRRDDFAEARKEGIIEHNEKDDKYVIPSAELNRLDSGLMLFTKLTGNNWSVDAIK